MKHKIIRRFKKYEQGDFYSYTAICSCGKEIGDWTPEKVEERAIKHLQEEQSSGETK